MTVEATARDQEKAQVKVIQTLGNVSTASPNELPHMLFTEMRDFIK